MRRLHGYCRPGHQPRSGGYRGYGRRAPGRCTWKAGLASEPFRQRMALGSRARGFAMVSDDEAVPAARSRRLGGDHRPGRPGDDYPLAPVTSVERENEFLEFSRVLLPGPVGGHPSGCRVPDPLAPLPVAVQHLQRIDDLVDVALAPAGRVDPGDA